MPVGVGERASWLVKLPLVALHHFTTPDCRRERFRRWYLVTFIMSMLWIAAYSYIMVWMITVIGEWVIMISVLFTVSKGFQWMGVDRVEFLYNKTKSFPETIHLKLNKKNKNSNQDKRKRK